MVNKVYNATYFHISGIWGKEEIEPKQLPKQLIQFVHSSEEYLPSRQCSGVWWWKGADCSHHSAQLPQADWHQPSQPETEITQAAAEAVSADSWLAFRMKASSSSFGPVLVHCSTCGLYCICLPSLSLALALLRCPALKRYWPREVFTARNTTNQLTKTKMPTQRRKERKTKEHCDQKPSLIYLKVVDAKPVHTHWCCYAYCYIPKAKHKYLLLQKVVCSIVLQTLPGYTQASIIWDNEN